MCISAENISYTPAIRDIALIFQTFRTLNCLCFFTGFIYKTLFTYESITGGR